MFFSRINLVNWTSEACQEKSVHWGSIWCKFFCIDYRIIESKLINSNKSRISAHLYCVRSLLTVILIRTDANNKMIHKEIFFLKYWDRKWAVSFHFYAFQYAFQNYSILQFDPLYGQLVLAFRYISLQALPALPQRVRGSTRYSYPKAPSIFVIVILS